MHRAVHQSARIRRSLFRARERRTADDAYRQIKLTRLVRHAVMYILHNALIKLLADTPREYNILPPILA